MRNSTILVISILAAFAMSRAGEPPIITSSEMHEAKYLDKTVRLQGFVRDIFSDELNPQYAFIVIQSETGLTYATTTLQFYTLKELRSLLNAKVDVTGACRPSLSEGQIGRQPRIYLGRILGITNIRVLEPPPSDPFAVPDIDEMCSLYPYQIQQLGLRKASGRVLATWGGNTALIETPAHSMMRVAMTEGALPSCGDFIEVAGFPDTDSYRINFNRAKWRRTQAWPVEDAPPRKTSAAEILTDGHGMVKVNFRMYGKPISLQGIIRTMPSEVNDNGVFQIDDRGYLLPVDVSSCRDVLKSLAVGTVVRVTGLCVFNIDNYRPNAVFPQINGFTTVVRNASDVEIVSRPSWWTVRRLGWLLALVLVVTAVVLVWNRSLSVLAERRGRQLSREQIARATSELKVAERTKLSAELHDALSQTLSGIAMQLGAIKRFAVTDPARMAEHLGIASRTLKSCRDEMCNILWDLRSRVLDEPDIEASIRQILEPHLDETDVKIRFAVPRARLTDSTARALFCIIRELVVNAIRHGHATSVRIAGSMENGRLMFSVRDNGCGFDPDAAPGADRGHFGLQGIRERMDALGGDFRIESVPGKGTKATATIAVRHEDAGKEETP